MLQSKGMLQSVSGTHACPGPGVTVGSLRSAMADTWGWVILCCEAAGDQQDVNSTSLLLGQPKLSLGTSE